MEAKYPGVCVECHHPIHVGEPIEGDPVTGWVHALCARGAALANSQWIACGGCYLSGNGLLVGGLCPDCRGAR